MITEVTWLAVASCLALAAVLILQVGLGIANVAAGLPLAVAVAHNAVAALLLAQVVVINFTLSRTASPS